MNLLINSDLKQINLNVKFQKVFAVKPFPSPGNLFYGTKTSFLLFFLFLCYNHMLIITKFPVVINFTLRKDFSIRILIPTDV